MENYSDADGVLRSWDINPLPEDVAAQFQHEFEKLVVLDYVIRNTGVRQVTLFTLLEAVYI